MFATLIQRSQCTREDSILIIACALASLNQPHLIPHLNINLQPEKLREALFKISAVTGIPKTINALAQLPSLKPQPMNESAMVGLHIMPQGLNWFSKVYTTQAERLLLKLAASHNKLTSSIIHSYGAVLGDFTTLNPYETEICLTAALVVQGGRVEAAQGFSHTRSLRIMGTSESMIVSIIALAKAVEKLVQTSSNL